MLTLDSGGTKVDGLDVAQSTLEGAQGGACSAHDANICKKGQRVRVTDRGSAVLSHLSMSLHAPLSLISEVRRACAATDLELLPDLTDGRTTTDLRTVGESRK